MPDRSRVPIQIPKFGVYITNSDKYLQAIDPSSGLMNWQRLGLTSQMATDWHDRFVKWRDKIYPKYSNALTSTSGAKKELRNFMKDFRKFTEPLLNLMAASPVANVTDELELRFKIKRRKPMRRRDAISETCTVGITPIGSGSMKIVCRAPEHEGRPHKPDGADSVQYAYVITDKEDFDINLTDPRLRKEISTRARFYAEFGSQNRGKWVTIYFRWYNTKRPELAGHWSKVHVMVIS